jgi:hypothetical protein
MKPLVLFFSCEPGGAEVLIPVIQYLGSDTDFSVLVLGYGLGGCRFSKAGIQFIEINEIHIDDNQLIEKYNPSVIITSATSLPQCDMSEKYLWFIARKNSVPSIAFLDQWQNYTPRFSGVGEDEKLKYLPDIINCINLVGKKEMLAEGFPKSRLIPLGQPYLSSIQKISSSIDRHKIREKLSISNNISVALFVSEPILENYGDTRGYDQYQALTLFLSAIAASDRTYCPIIKLHPKDNICSFETILNKYPSISPVVVKNESTSTELLSVSDLVVGMTSIMLIEAYILGCAVVSLQPNLKIKDPLILSRLNLIPISIDSKKFSICDIGTKELNETFEYVFNISNFKNILDSTLKCIT